MNEVTKIILSADELRVLKERAFFEKKRKITEKVYHLFAEVVQASNEESIFEDIHFPSGTDYTTGKITRGENYLGYPYLLLDFPRYFNGKNIMAIRTMLWWGNFISCTLLISGDKTMAAGKALSRHKGILSKSKTWLCVNESPWFHHFENYNFQLIDHLIKRKRFHLTEDEPFIKIARKLPIGRTKHFLPFTIESFNLYAQILREI